MDEWLIPAAFPCGHVRLIPASDDRFTFEPDGIRITGEIVIYCQTCYRQTPKEFTWLEPGQMFIYTNEEQAPCKPKKAFNSSTQPQASSSTSDA